MAKMTEIKNFLLQWAEIIDAFRVVPRLILLAYCIFTWRVYTWITTLETPTVEQTGILYAIIGTAAMIFNFYAKSGRAWGPQVEWQDISASNSYLKSQSNSFYKSRRHYDGDHHYDRGNPYSSTSRRKPHNVEEEEGDA